MDRIAPIVGLANRWFQPLTHLSLLWRVCCLSDCKVNTIFFPCKIFTEKIFLKGLLKVKEKRLKVKEKRKRGKVKGDGVKAQLVKG